MSYLVKGLAGAAGCSGLAGGGYWASKYLGSGEDSRSTAKSLIIDSGRTLLGVNSDQWVDRWSEYVNSGGNGFGIEGYSESSKNKSSVPDAFKNACLNKVNEKVSGTEDPLFQNLSTYCISMTAITQLVTNEGREMLSDSNDGDGWNAAWTSYLSNPEGNKWNIPNWNTQTSGSVPQELKTNCTSKKAEKAYGVKDIKFQNVRDWCTKAKAVRH
ncbi:hypothetical protein MHF_1269 [Mycoplasma haemofelis Ohio2]|uniref:Uncharacterized protein n=1 Tax=Mycoplasma haemofelis (strain Ohio2) TaxID=859194 RepID=F6FFT7_MYCHI|nr:hypothetical protein MHF_1269 [Mycoplasma haemofelis Ohio2]